MSCKIYINKWAYPNRIGGVAKSGNSKFGKYIFRSNINYDYIIDACMDNNYKRSHEFARDDSYALTAL